MRRLGCDPIVFVVPETGGCQEVGMLTYPEAAPQFLREDAARIIQIAALCSKAVYKKDPGHVVPQLLDYAVKDRHWIEPTRDGSGKAAALFEILPTDPSSQRKALVVAVRGSASSVDWLVNLNSDLAECSDLVCIAGSPNVPELLLQDW
ncbi:hypothetical protein CTAM01_10964 [Colletotrichum tamarilloi]|uniref:Uncharacterized protein n=1 Tax=Colletotrichum tamarilloi TaxID=1209934 RepID=A0ABQ9QYS0_9PEZI|nr:uncharacterized protein CTAM01_10964 [Colletotrichum tamarilloi]KAK1489748.1 hypothetical protein CTAM01_10964 [Colletotrichum tamarilloi]